MKHKVYISETWVKLYEVEAPSLSEAEDIATDFASGTPTKVLPVEVSNEFEGWELVHP